MSKPAGKWLSFPYQLGSTLLALGPCFGDLTSTTLSVPGGDADFCGGVSQGYTSDTFTSAQEAFGTRDSQSPIL